MWVCFNLFFTLSQGWKAQTISWCAGPKSTEDRHSQEDAFSFSLEGYLVSSRQSSVYLLDKLVASSGVHTRFDTAPSAQGQSATLKSNGSLLPSTVGAATSQQHILSINTSTGNQVGSGKSRVISVHICQVKTQSTNVRKSTFTFQNKSPKKQFRLSEWLWFQTALNGYFQQFSLWRSAHKRVRLGDLFSALLLREHTQVSVGTEDAGTARECSFNQGTEAPRQPGPAAAAVKKKPARPLIRITTVSPRSKLHPVDSGHLQENEENRHDWARSRWLDLHHHAGNRVRCPRATTQESFWYPVPHPTFVETKPKSGQQRIWYFWIVNVFCCCRSRLMGRTKEVWNGPTRVSNKAPHLKGHTSFWHPPKTNKNRFWKPTAIRLLLVIGGIVTQWKKRKLRSWRRHHSTTST